MRTLPFQAFRDAMCKVLPEGEDVLVHASLSAFGRIDSTVENIINAIRAPMGPDATLVMMTDTRSFAKTARFSLSQPSETGLLTETFRRMPGVVRSCVPMVSFAALGPRASDYTQPYHSYLDETSTINRLLAHDGRILLLGVGYYKCTLYHLAEERVGVSYNCYKEFAGTLFESGHSIGPISQRYFVRSDLEIRKDPSIAGEMLDARGDVILEHVGNGMVRSFKARAFDECCTQALMKDSNAFIARKAFSTT